VPLFPICDKSEAAQKLPQPCSNAAGLILLFVHSLSCQLEVDRINLLGAKAAVIE
jgi:hypothetical protein